MPEINAQDFRTVAEALRRPGSVALGPEGRKALADWLDNASLDALYMDTDEPECRLVAALLAGANINA